MRNSSYPRSLIRLDLGILLLHPHSYQSSGIGTRGLTQVPNIKRTDYSVLSDTLTPCTTAIMQVSLQALVISALTRARRRSSHWTAPE